MKPEEYSWNEWERNRYINGDVKVPSEYKIKVIDIPQKRLELEKLLEQLPHKEVARWAVENTRRFIEDIESFADKESIIEETLNVFQQRLEGKISAYQLRQAGFLANTLSKRSKADICKFAARVYTQAIASAHMRGHAIVSSDYAIKVIQLKDPLDLDRIRAERERQIALAQDFLKKVGY
ncbi:putative immunity protein [Granulicatella adiacens]